MTQDSSHIKLETNKKTKKIRHGTETILIVDDEEQIVNLTRQMLERLGYKVEVQLKPDEALKVFKLKANFFDLVITDMMMPQMNGIKLSEQLMAIQPDIPIILCTGYSHIVDEDIAKQYGISSYIMKPVTLRKLAEAIREVLDKPTVEFTGRRYP